MLGRGHRSEVTTPGEIARGERVRQFQERQDHREVVEHIELRARLDQGEESNDCTAGHEDLEQSLNIGKRTQDARDEEIHQ